MNIHSVIIIQEKKWDWHGSSSDICEASLRDPGHLYGNREDFALTVMECWVPSMCLSHADKKCHQQGGQMILFCCSKPPKHNSCGDLAYNWLNAEPDDLRWAGLNAFGWVCLNINTYLFALIIKFSFKLNPLNSHRPKSSVCYDYIQQSIVQLCHCLSWQNFVVQTINHQHL